MPRYSLRSRDLPERGRRNASAAADQAAPPGESLKRDSFRALVPAPVGIWLLLQCVALVLAAARVPLAAAFPQPAEFQAERLMLAAQFVGASLLFPSLLGSWRMLLASICTAAVMLALASALASWSIPQVGPIALFVALWLIFLAILRASLPTFLHLAASALVSAYVIGGVLLWYLRADFGGSELVGPSWSYGPLCAALISPAKLPNPMWWGIVGMIAVALAAFFGHRLWKTPAP